MKIFTLLSNGIYVAYEGMTLDEINTMLADQGLTCQAITDEAWQSAMAENQKSVMEKF